METNDNQKLFFGLIILIILVLFIIGFIVFMFYGCFKIIKLFVTFRNEMNKIRCYDFNTVESIPLNTIHQNENGN